MKFTATPLTTVRRYKTKSVEKYRQPFLFYRSLNKDSQTSTHYRLPPAPLKLRPNGTLQICLLLL